MYQIIRFSTGAGSPGTFQAIFDFQHLHASLKCYIIVLVLFALIPSGIISWMSAITAYLSSRSNWLSTRYFVIVLAIPLECRPSNCLASKLPSHRSSNGTIPQRKKIQTRQLGAQKPTPGPFPTYPVLNLEWMRCLRSLVFLTYLISLYLYLYIPVRWPIWVKM